jgi:hypothetical protein
LLRSNTAEGALDWSAEIGRDDFRSGRAGGGSGDTAVAGSTDEVDVDHHQFRGDGNIGRKSRRKSGFATQLSKHVPHTIGSNPEEVFGTSGQENV